MPLLAALAVFLADQVSKRLFVAASVRNPGVAYGFAGEHPVAVAVAVLAALGAVAWLYGSSTARLAERCLWGVVLGGIAGNLADRFRVGAVIDPFVLPHIPLHWNIADAAITGGIAGLIVLSLARKR